jgi:hypothetical protein
LSNVKYTTQTNVTSTACKITTTTTTITTTTTTTAAAAAAAAAVKTHIISLIDIPELQLLLHLLY